MDIELNAENTIAKPLGPRTIPTPLEEHILGATPDHHYYSDENRVLVRHLLPEVKASLEKGEELACFEVAGPRKKLFFDPSRTTCGILTCGGICPGLNDVIRSLVITAHFRYGVRRILGFRYGFEGLNPSFGHKPVELTPEWVENIHRFGGTALGTSRGPQETSVMLDYLQEMDVQVLFVIGGDGSQRGALAICEEARKRAYPLAVVGIPKTIDNDMIFMDKSFGFETASAAAVEIVHAAHTEAVSARNGVGLVKVMGRHSGFIACAAAIASGEVNVVLIPEVPFALEGPNGFLEYLRQRVLRRGHAVVVVAEGAGQEYLPESNGYDASGNKKLGDIGIFLRDKIQNYFHECCTDLTLKYIDPSYVLRGIPAGTQDRIYCQRLAQAAVHAAMAGKTGIVVARWHSVYVHVPIAIAVAARRTVDSRRDIWFAVLEATGQPARFY
ncbi:MAG: ATP-dependent 6-phosphofructokinase [Chthoniobacterales bacterium]|nr:ATP-dependent 6-phosphofructokinase [Chthoniobacterales bacterium]